MITFIIIYLVTIILYWLFVRQCEPFDDRNSAALVFILMFIPIINTITLIIYFIIGLIIAVDWIKFSNKFFKLK